jgi:Protein of unknown function DUF262/Protein of unknown function (DUF1524)
VKPDTHTVQQLFERDIRYAVPLYQRSYVWDEEHQWEPLWSDIEAMLEHQGESDPTPVWSHFIGAIVLDQEQTAPGQIPRFTVIDGQQRLTTLQLLLAAAAAALDDTKCPDDAALLRELTQNNPRKAKGVDQLKVWPTNANRNAFQAVMRPGGPDEDHEDDPHNLIDEAYEYFRKRAAEYLNGAEEDAARQVRGEQLRITLCDLLKLVSIRLETGDNAQVIFETLNARGTPLLALDLVKNVVFYQASLDGADTDVLYNEVWLPQLDDDYWRKERRQGRLFRPIGELFLMHWLTMRLERAIPATELFATFRQSVLDGSTAAEDLIGELCADAAVMRSFDDVQADTPEGEFFRRLGPLDASTVLPLVLLLFRSPEVSIVRRRRALRILESWLARRALMRLTAKNYNRIVPRLLVATKGDLEHVDDVLLRELRAGEGEISRWPTDEEFADVLTNRDLYNVVSQMRIVMALEAIEQSLYSNKVDLSQIPTGLSVEHLMPKQWPTAWPLAEDLSEEQLELATAERQSRLHRLGNLTIVTQPLNSSLSNGDWSSKRKALNNHSKLLVNAELAEIDAWDEEAIDRRTKRLAKNLVAIWPGPGNEEWGGD